jgi:hypothetical protein
MEQKRIRQLKDRTKLVGQIASRTKQESNESKGQTGAEARLRNPFYLAFSDKSNFGQKQKNKKLAEQKVGGAKHKSSE